MDWQPVMDPLAWPAKYVRGFDPERLYQFKRGADEEVQSFRLSDAGSYFNIANLYWRDPLSKIAP